MNQKLKLRKRSIWVITLVIGLMLLAINCKVTQTINADFYISVNGKDTNPGTKKSPFKTIAAARDAVRKKVTDGLTKNVLVLIRSGTYRFTETLTFGPEDSGTKEYSVTYAAYPGEKVVLSGGRRINDWKKGTDGIWTAEIPEVSAGIWNFRQLFVNDNRAIRARIPNSGDPESWWKIVSSTANKDNPPAENDPITVKVNGRLSNWSNPGDIELVYMQNNECGWKRLESINEQAQTFNLAPPHRWNPRVFIADWYLSIPFAGKPCYLENSMEMLDQPGEWYLDRHSGILHYLPLQGEDLSVIEVVAPVLQKTVLAIAGTRERPVLNLHFKGLQVQHVDWPLPAWGYMAMFCCNVATTDRSKPGHRPIDAAIEFSNARSCSFNDGGIAHVGGMGLCIREGTADIIVEGNEIFDLSGGGIAAGWPNSAAGYLEAAPPPLPGEFTGYRIANNIIHHCGTDYFGAVGILLFPSNHAVVAHNLIYNTAYLGIGVAGSQDPMVHFAGNNLIEYNHIHDAMTTTIDGAGIYVTFAQDGQGTRLRGNVIHDTHGNPYHLKWGAHPPSAGLYLDGNSNGGIYENNLLYRNLAAGPLILNYPDAQKKNQWVDNIFAKDSLPPAEFLEAAEALAGPEPAYQQSLLKQEPNPCIYSVLSDTAVSRAWAAYQYHFSSKNHGILQVMVRDDNKDNVARFKLRGLDGMRSYKLKAYVSPITPQNVWGPGQMPMSGKTDPADIVTLGLSGQIPGYDLLKKELELKIGSSPQIIWIIYQATK